MTRDTGVDDEVDKDVVEKRGRSDKKKKVMIKLQRW